MKITGINNVRYSTENKAFAVLLPLMLFSICFAKQNLQLFRCKTGVNAIKQLLILKAIYKNKTAAKEKLCA